MKSLAVTKDHALEIVDIPIPEIADDCVLTKTLACGICSGTDTKILHGKNKGVTDYPLLLGHEAIGEVVAVGKNVKRFKQGDHVLCTFIEPGVDGQYAGYYRAWGGFSEYTVARDYEAMEISGKGPGTPDFWDAYYTQKVIPKDIDPQDAVMIITLCEVLAAIKNFCISENDKVVVYGVGAVGLTFIKLLKLLGVKTIISVDVAEAKRQEAISMGADYFINGKTTSVVDSVKEISPEGIQYVIDAVGANSIVNEALKIIVEGGRICIYGICPEKEFTLSWEEAPQNWDLRYFHVPIKEEQAAATGQIIEWVHQGKIKLSDHISHKLPFDQILDAFDLIKNRVPIKKIVITF